MKRDVTELLQTAHTKTMQMLFLAALARNKDLMPKYYSKDEVMTMLDQLNYYADCGTDEALLPLLDEAYIFLFLQSQKKYPNPYAQEAMRKDPKYRQEVESFSW